MFFQQDIETAKTEDIVKLQEAKLKKQVKYMYENIDFYKKSLDSAGVAPEDISSLADLQKLPFTLKQDLRDAYPFGLFAVGQKEVQRIHCSSGTTGKACVVGYTSQDISDWGDCTARALVASGGSNNSMVQVSYGYGLFTGGLGLHEGSASLGATVVPTSSGNTKRQIQLLKDFKTDILCCTPSYALLIADTAISMGLDPKVDFNLSSGIMGAEPFSSALRCEIEEKLGIKVFDIYGLSEIMGPGVACECSEHSGLHVCEDHFIVEIIDPDTLQPVEDGQYGELVFTTLSKQCSPFIRYRTRDISRILPGTCPCGRTHRRIDRISGRTDDMLIIRGVNVFPSQFEEVIASNTELSPHYKICLSRKGSLDHVELFVETAQHFEFDEVRKIEALKRKLASDLQSNLQVSVDIKFVEPKTIERFEGKAKRVYDLRED